jgi:hypothetical protein
MKNIDHYNMNNEIDIIKLALEYYDKQSEKYDVLLKTIHTVDFETAKHDLDYNKIFMYNKDKELILESKYEIMGAYYPNTNIWIWGWSLHKLNKYYVKIIKNLFDYGIQLNPNTPNNSFLKMELVTSRFKISDKIQLEIYAAIAAYLSKTTFVFKYDSNIYDLDNKTLKSKEEIIYYLFIDKK